jgi:hypothetical protein
MSLAEKRRMERAKEVLKSHPDYVRIAMERVYGSGKVIANLIKEIAWLRGIERELDTVVLEHLVKNDYVSQLEGRRYGITIRGKKLIDDHAARARVSEERKVANG